MFNDLLLLSGGDPTIPTFASERIYRLDGVDGYMEEAFHADLDFERTDAFSFSFFIERNSQNSTELILQKQESTFQRGYQMAFITGEGAGTENKFRMAYRSDSGSSNLINLRSVDTLLPSDGRVHIVIAYGGLSLASDCDLFINGGGGGWDTALTDNLTNTIQSVAPFAVGRFPPSDSLFGDFDIDEILVVKQKINQVQATQLSNLAEPSALFPAANIIRNWGIRDVDVGTFPSIKDFSDNNQPITAFRGSVADLVAI